MIVENFKHDYKSKATWTYNGIDYTIHVDGLLNAHCFEEEKTILIVFGRYGRYKKHRTETQMYAYDLCGNFKFEVLPPENYAILWGKKVSLKGRGGVMGIACEPLFETKYGDGSLYAVDPINGALTYTGIVRI